MKKTILIALCVTMTACAGAPDPTESTSDQGLICGENCDPAHFQSLISQLVGDAWGLGVQVSDSLNCQHYDADCFPGVGCLPASDECSAIYQDPWGQQYLVDCTSAYGCDHEACGWPNSDQSPCR